MREFVVISCILVLILFLSGCTSTTPVEHVLAVKNFIVRAPGEISTESTVPITFWLKNQGNFIAKNTEIKFFDLQGFEIEKIECVGWEKKSVDLGFCTIGEIKPGRANRIDVELKSPEDSGKKTVSYYVNSDYSGISKLLFSVWDKDEEDPHGNVQSVNSGGPLSVNIDSSFLIGVSSSDGESFDKWVEEGEEFTIYITTKKVSSNYNFVGGKIEKENFKIKLEYIEPADGKCDLTKSGDYWIPKNDIDLEQKQPLTCKMKVKDIDGQKWVTGNIEVDYTYRYMFIEQYEFEIE